MTPRTNKMEMRKHVCLALGVLVFTSTQPHAGESACKSIKNDVRNIKSLTDPQKRYLRDEISILIKADEMCAKNLLGRMYYEGGGIEKDADKAEAIFYDLAQRAYPPALYNLAYLKIKQGSTDAEEILAYLHGIMAKYIGDEQWRYLAANARDLGWEYLDALSSNPNFSGDLKELREKHGAVAKISAKEMTESLFSVIAKAEIVIEDPRKKLNKPSNIPSKPQGFDSVFEKSTPAQPIPETYNPPQPIYTPLQSTEQNINQSLSVGVDTILSIIEIGLAIATIYYTSKAADTSRKTLALMRQNRQLAPPQEIKQNFYIPPSLRSNSANTTNAMNKNGGLLVPVTRMPTPPSITTPTIQEPKLNTPPKLWRPATDGLPSGYYIAPFLN